MAEGTIPVVSVIITTRNRLTRLPRATTTHTEG
jgi:hypothetical protein